LDNLEKNTNVLHFRYGFKLGGVEKFILSIIQNTKLEDKIKHHILIFNDSYDDFLIEELKALGCEVFIIKKADTRNPLTVFKIVKFLKKYKIDVVHSHDPGGFKWISMCKLFVTGIKQVFTSHDTDVVTNLSKIDKFLISKVVDKNAAISKSILNEFKNSGAVKNTELVYNCINLEKFAGINEKIDFHSEELKIVNLAWLWLPKKGQDVLIKALGECKKHGIKFSCDFIGGTFDEYSHNIIENLVKQNNLEENLNFQGKKDNIPQLLANYNLFIFPSRYEGLPLSLLEGLAAGLPVISSNINGSNEIITNEENGLLFESENHNELAEKISDLYNNRQKMQNLAKNGYNYIKSFDLPVMCNKYYEIYKILKK